MTIEAAKKNVFFNSKCTLQFQALSFSICKDFWYRKSIIEVRNFSRMQKWAFFLIALWTRFIFCGIALSTINPNKVEFIFMLACKQVLPVQYDITLVKNIYPDFIFIVANKSWKIYPIIFFKYVHSHKMTDDWQMSVISDSRRPAG